MEEASTFLAKDRYAVVTCANKGIGLEICKPLAFKGVTVVLTTRDKRRGIEAVEKLKESGLSEFYPFSSTWCRRSRQYCFSGRFHQNPLRIMNFLFWICLRVRKSDLFTKVNNAGITGVLVDGDALSTLGFGKPGVQINRVRLLLKHMS